MHSIFNSSYSIIFFSEHSALSIIFILNFLSVDRRFFFNFAEYINIRILYFLYTETDIIVISINIIILLSLILLSQISRLFTYYYKMNCELWFFFSISFINFSFLHIYIFWILGAIFFHLFLSFHLNLFINIIL